VPAIVVVTGLKQTWCKLKLTEISNGDINNSYLLVHSAYEADRVLVWLVAAALALLLKFKQRGPCNLRSMIFPDPWDLFDVLCLWR
jgi:hypothetical protein